MSGGGGSNDGSNDMQVSGAEAAYSNEPGISTHAESRTGAETNRGGSQDHRTTNYSPDTSTVGDAAPNYSGLDQEGQAEFDRAKSISQGTITIDPMTGEERPGRYRTNPNTGELENADLSFKQHWANRPDAIKWSPTLSLLYAGGKNAAEFAKYKGFGFTGGSTSGGNNNTGGGGDGERARMNTIAPHAPYIVSGTTKPTDSPAQLWYQSLGASSTNPSGFNLATEYAAAKLKVKNVLGNSTPVGQLAVNDTPYFNFLKKNNLDKGIL